MTTKAVTGMFLNTQLAELVIEQGIKKQTSFVSFAVFMWVA